MAFTKLKTVYRVPKNVYNELSDDAKKMLSNANRKAKTARKKQSAKVNEMKSMANLIAKVLKGTMKTSRTYKKRRY